MTSVIRADRIKYVDITVTTEANSTVPPFSYYGNASIPIPYTSIVLTASFHGNSGQYGNITIKDTQSGEQKVLYVYTGKQITNAKIRVVYI